MTRISTSKIKTEKVINCNLSRARAKVVFKAFASSVEREDTRLIDAGRKERQRRQGRMGDRKR